MTENKKKSNLKNRLKNLVKGSKKAAVIGAAITTMAVGGKANAAVGSPMRHGSYSPPVQTYYPPVQSSQPSVSTPVRTPTPVRTQGQHCIRQGYGRSHQVVRGHHTHQGRPMFGRGSRGGMMPHVRHGQMRYRLHGNSVQGGMTYPRGRGINRAPQIRSSMPRMNRGGFHRGGSFAPRGPRGGGFSPRGPRGGRGRR